MKKNSTKSLISSILFLFLLLILPYNSLSSELNPATVSIESYDHSKNFFSLKISIQDGWNLYGPYLGDDGIPLSISSSDSNNLKGIDIVWPTPIYTKVGNSHNNIYKTDINVGLKVIPTDESKYFSSRITINMSACKDICRKFNQSIYINNATSTQHTYFLLMLLFAFTGGLILNFMPCVLPVILLKIHSFIRHNESSQESRRRFCIFTCLGIITVFLLMASMAIFTKAMGEYAGWGFHFQNSKFITFLCILTFLSALIINGDLNISPPALLRGSNYDSISSFSSAALATILSTPCTAPFLTPAIGFALSNQWYIILLIHLFIGLGMSTPFILFFITPKTFNFIPRSGSWIDWFKKISAIGMMCVAVWLIYIIYNQLGAKPSILIAGLLLLLKFSLIKLKGKSSIAVSSVLIFSILYLPTFVSIQDIEDEKEIDGYWETFSEKKIEHYKSKGEIVFLDITADWCVICKANKFLVLDNIELLEFLKSENVKLMRGDITSNSEDIMNFMKKNNRKGIPYNVMYGNNSPYIIVFPEILTIFDIKKGVKKLKNGKL